MKPKYRFVLLMAGVVATCLYAFFTAPYFAVKNIQIEGLRYISEDKLSIATEVLKKKHIFSVLFLYPYKNKILIAYPQIQTISFKLVFPNQVRVVVKEKPEWVSFLTEKQHYLIAQDGTILNKKAGVAQGVELENLMIFTGIPDKAFEEAKIPDELLSIAQQVLSNVKPYLAIYNLQIEIKSDSDFVLIKEDALPIKLGALDNLDIKFSHLKYFLESGIVKELGSIEYIDLRLEDRLVVKYRSKDVKAS